MDLGSGVYDIKGRLHYSDIYARDVGEDGAGFDDIRSTINTVIVDFVNVY